jgi:hypothetical protein
MQAFIFCQNAMLHQNIKQREFFLRCRVHNFDLIASHKNNASIWMETRPRHAALLKTGLLMIVQFSIDSFKQSHSLRVARPLGIDRFDFVISVLDPIEDLLFFGLFGVCFDLSLLLHTTDLGNNNQLALM